MTRKEHKEFRSDHTKFITAVKQRKLGKVKSMLRNNPGLVKASIQGMGPLQTLMLTRGLNFYTKWIAKAIIHWMAEEDKDGMRATIEANRRHQWTTDSHEVIVAILGQ